MRMLENHAPEIETVSLYEVLPNDSGKHRGDGSFCVDCDTKRTVPSVLSTAGTWTVFDPCAAARLSDDKKSEITRKCVREHATALGITLEPMPVQENVPRCCGFGGQPECADPVFVDSVRANRAAESELPYICYCVNCREAFMKTGKESAHILELRYAGREDLCPPELSPSARRLNREALKTSLLGNDAAASASVFTTQKEPSPLCSSPLCSFADGVLERMDKDKILAEDVSAVVNHALRSKESVCHPASGVHSGSLVIGRTTYWVDFTRDGDRVVVLSAYSHRLEIEHEAVWAGAPRELRLKAARETRAESVSSDREALVCDHDGSELSEMDAEFLYLERSFKHKVMRCPACGFAYIPESLARGRMREVEMSLEDK